MSEITVKGRIGDLHQGFWYHGDAMNGEITIALAPLNELATFRVKRFPADWQEGQEVEITIRTVTK